MTRLDDLSPDGVVSAIRKGDAVLALCGGCGVEVPHVLISDEVVFAAATATTVVARPDPHTDCHAPRRKVLGWRG